MGGMDENRKLYEQTLSYSATTGPYQSLTLPWWAQTPKRLYYPRHRCSIEPLICGEEVFARIADDLNAATRSIDIITWGFDPGMVLKRGFKAQDGQRYGDLLQELATRKKDPVKVISLYTTQPFPSRIDCNAVATSITRCKPCHIVLTPGSPSLLRARKPPSWAISRRTSLSRGGSAG